MLGTVIKVGAAGAAVYGAKKAYDGYNKFEDARKIVDETNEKRSRNKNRFESSKEDATVQTDRLVKKELEIFESFAEFSDIMEKLQNVPEFVEYKIGEDGLPNHKFEKIKNISVVAEETLAAIRAGQFGGFGGLAFGGLGAIAFGGLNGIFIGFGAGIFIGGMLFDAQGSSALSEAEKARSQVNRETQSVNKICEQLKTLENLAHSYYNCFVDVEKCYREHLQKLSYIVNDCERTDCNYFNDDEMLLLENTSRLVGLLYNMGKVKIFTQKSNSENNSDDIGTIHSDLVESQIQTSYGIIHEIAA